MCCVALYVVDCCRALLSVLFVQELLMMVLCIVGVVVFIVVIVVGVDNVVFIGVYGVLLLCANVCVVV